MHRAFAAMGGLPRRAPVPATITLLAPPAPPQSGPNQKKPASQGPPAGHKCSRCKTRPKSGSGSSLCIRCKLQREYGSPRGGFAAPRKKIPPVAQPAPPAVALHTPAVPTSSVVPNVEVPALVPTTNTADALNHVKSREKSQSIETIQLEVAGEPSLRIDRMKLKSHRVLTESDWSSLKEELENEKDDFLPEDLDQTIQIELLSAQGLPVSVALPAEIMGAIDTTSSSAPRVEVSRPPPVVSMPELPQVEEAASPSDKSQSLLEEARNSIRLYGPAIEAAFNALHASTSQAKWVTVLSVYQKKAVLAKILKRLADLESKLLLPGESSVSSRLSRSIEQLFNSMNLLRGRMQVPASNNTVIQAGLTTNNNSNNSNKASSNKNTSNNPVAENNSLRTSCDVNSPAQQMSPYNCLPQNSSGFCERPQEAYSPYSQPNIVSVKSEASFQTAKSLKDEADEEIKKILAKLQSEDRNFPPTGQPPMYPVQTPPQAPPPPHPLPVVKPMVTQQAVNNRGMFADSNNFNMQPTVARNFQTTYNGQIDAPVTHYPVQAMNMWDPSMVNSNMKNCVNNPPLVNGAVMRSADVSVNSPMSSESFGQTAKRICLPQGRQQQCPPQMSSGSIVSAPQLRNLLARKVTPLPNERVPPIGQQNQTYYGSGQLNHAQSQEQLSSGGYINNLNTCNRKPTLSVENMNSPGLAQATPDFSMGNNYPPIYTPREQLAQQSQQYHVQAHHNGPPMTLGSNEHISVNSQPPPPGPQNGRGPLQGLAVHPLQQVDQVISNESFTAQWSGSNLGVFNLRG